MKEFAKFICLTLLLIFCIVPLMNGQIKKPNVKESKRPSKHKFDNPMNDGAYCDSLMGLVYRAPCEMLSNLSDTVFLRKFMPWDCLPGVARRFQSSSGVIANMQSGFHEVNYYNTSLGKSLFKHDLIMWSRHFGCPDTLALKVQKQGSFNKFEYETMKSHDWFLKCMPNRKASIDTAILE